MDEILKQYAEWIISTVGGMLILGILTAVFMGKDSRFAQLIGNFILGSF